MTKTNEEIVALVRDTLVDAGSTFREDKKDAYKRAITTERNEQAKKRLGALKLPVSSK